MAKHAQLRRALHRNDAAAFLTHYARLPVPPEHAGRTKFDAMPIVVFGPRRLSPVASPLEFAMQAGISVYRWDAQVSEHMYPILVPRWVTAAIAESETNPVALIKWLKHREVDQRALLTLFAIQLQYGRKLDE